MNHNGKSRPLFRIVAERVLIFGAAAMLLQMIVVVYEYYSDTPELARLLIGWEADGLGEGLTSENGGWKYKLPSGSQRYAGKNSGYYARIRLADGTVLFSSCTPPCSDQFLPLAGNSPDFWMRQLSPDKPISVSGGLTLRFGGQRVLIELAVVGDREGRIWSVIAHEVADDMAAPMGLMLVLVLGGVLVSVRRSLQPVTVAAELAHRLDPRSPHGRMSPEGMPREIGDLVTAINKSLDRIGELIESRKIFTSAVVHELRTPLAAMKLDLGRVQDPRARRAEAEIERLSHFVDQVTALARVDIASLGDRDEVDLAQVCTSRVMQLADWVYEQGHSIEFRDHGGARLLGNEVLLENAVGNLIENAVRHTPPGTHITVEVGPEPSMTVFDDAGLSDRSHRSEEQASGKIEPVALSGLGLQIVEKIAALHGGRFSIQSSEGKTIARLKFASKVLSSVHGDKGEKDES